MNAPATTEVAKYSREWFIERLGPEVVADVLAQVAAAPKPSPEKVAELRRLFDAPRRKLQQQSQ
jgi:hypothetical protein